MDVPPHARHVDGTEVAGIPGFDGVCGKADVDVVDGGDAVAEADQRKSRQHALRTGERSICSSPAPLVAIPFTRRLRIRQRETLVKSPRRLRNSATESAPHPTLDM